MSSPVVEPPAALGKWCGLTWRRSSENEGPGSIFGENRGKALGSAIERGAYSRHSTPQCKPPLPRRELVVAIEVFHRSEQPVGDVVNLSDGNVAPEAEDAAHATGH